jgi:hypothetical protein
MIALAVALVLLAALAALQLLLVFGAPLGRFAWGGQHALLPARLRVGSVISAVIYVAIALMLLSRIGVIGGGGTFVRVATWVIFGFFVLSILVNAISRSRLERLTMTPVATALALATLNIALAD